MNENNVSELVAVVCRAVWLQKSIGRWAAVRMVMNRAKVNKVTAMRCLTIAAQCTVADLQAQGLSVLAVGMVAD